jgi:hypothetical protein
MEDSEWQDHLEAYSLYKQLVEVLIGHDVKIALLALQKCKINLILAQSKDDDRE